MELMVSNFELMASNIELMAFNFELMASNFELMGSNFFSRQQSNLESKKYSPTIKMTKISINNICYSFDHIFHSNLSLFEKYSLFIILD